MKIIALVTTALSYTLIVIACTLYVIREDVARQLDEAQQIANNHTQELADCSESLSYYMFKDGYNGIK